MYSVKKCLLIDDDPDDHELFAIALEAIDRSVHCSFAKDGLYGLELLEESGTELPDVIFLDLNMPRMGGKECLHTIRSVREYDHIPVVILTTSVNRFDQVDTLAGGAVDFITKPSLTAEFVSELQRVFEKLSMRSMAADCKRD